MRVREGLPAAEERSAAVAVVGNFDGVHRGHQQLLTAAVAEAGGTGARAIAVSFEPHPSRILHPEAAPRLITPRREKIELIASMGVDELWLLPFTRDLSLLGPREFLECVLCAGMELRALHEGENFRFGHRHAGDVGLLRQMGEEMGFAARIHASVRVRGALVSSSRVREQVGAGEVGMARALLGRVFSVRGRIARGRGIGRQRTVPTLNLEPYDELLPANGVYLTHTVYHGGIYESLTNVGVRPTFGPGARTVETYLLDPPVSGLDPEVDDEMTIGFLRRSRDEIRFARVEELRAAIEDDIRGARRFFARLAAVR